MGVEGQSLLRLDAEDLISKQLRPSRILQVEGYHPLMGIDPETSQVIEGGGGGYQELGEPLLPHVGDYSFDSFLIHMCHFFLLADNWIEDKKTLFQLKAFHLQDCMIPFILII